MKPDTFGRKPGMEKIRKKVFRRKSGFA